LTQAGYRSRLDRDLMAAQARGEVMSISGRFERRPRRGTGIEGKPAARSERAAGVEPG